MSALPVDMEFTGSELGARVALRGPDNKDHNYAPYGQTVRAGAETMTVHPTPDSVQKSQAQAKQQQAEKKLDPRVQRLAARQRLAPGFYRQRLERLKLAPSQRVLANSAQPSQLTRRRRPKNDYKALDPNQTKQVSLDKSNVMNLVTKARNDFNLAKKIVSLTPEGAIADLVKKAVKAAVAPAKAPAQIARTAALGPSAPSPAAGRRRKPGMAAPAPA